MQPQDPPSHVREDSSSGNSPIVSSSQARQKLPLANIAVFPFIHPQAQASTSTRSFSVSSPVRRKPLPANASPVVARFSSAENLRSKLVNRTIPTRSFSIDSPSPTAVPRLNTVTVLSPPLTAIQADFPPGNPDSYPHGQTLLDPDAPYDLDDAISETDTHKPLEPFDQYRATYSRNSSRPPNGRAPSSYHTAQASISESLSRTSEASAVYKDSTHTRTPTMSSYNSVHRPPDLTLQFDGVPSEFLHDGTPSPDSYTASKRPKSPAGSKLTSFFGWNSKGAQGADASPTTLYSEASLSPSNSPRQPHQSPPMARKPTGLDIPKANEQMSYFNVPGTPLLSNSPGMNAHVEELERELREVSSELAHSIRREMELEDEIERWKAEAPSSASLEAGKRTSDYYSDSGASSVRYPYTDSDVKIEELERLRRKAEQEKGRLKTEMATKIQEELRRRRDLEAQVHQLEEQLQSSASKDAGSERVRELEIALDDARRRMTEERQVKDGFEDLLTAMREELEKHRNERDNLRDEVVPQLRARLEVLEAESANTQSLSYEISRLQQENEALRAENDTLKHSQKRFNSIAEEGTVASPRVGLTRSNSLARSSVHKKDSVSQFKRGSLSRSNSVLERSESLPEIASDRLKDVEAQRDALHRALKSLLHRQEYQAREFEKRIKALEIERDRALNLTPRRTAFHEEVSLLRDEINHLRRRADEAVEQKWQVEKGLGGLRMDLDRAEQETASLRTLLQEHDIFVPERKLSGASPEDEDSSQTISLDKAYKELQTTHALSLATIREMEGEDAGGSSLEGVERVMQLLKQSISSAEAERDAAQQEAEQYRQQARALQESEIQHLVKEQSLSGELFASATRMDELAAKVQQQLQSNRDLKVRLADAIARGEQEQQKSAAAILELQRKLKAAEDKVTSAHQASEEAVTKHEEEVRRLQEGHNNQLQRMKSGFLSPGKHSPDVPLSPLFANRSPRLDKTTSGPSMTMAEATRKEFLEKRVVDLEKALSDADREMEEVVSRMNMAQIEVAELQSQRDEAMRQTRRLQAEIVEERERVKMLMS